MPKITYIPLTPGVSIVDSQCDTLVNTVNCVGVMGAGVALAFKQKWPTIMYPYGQLCKEGGYKPGSVVAWPIPGTYRMVLNVATKNDWRQKSQFTWIVDILCELTLTPWDVYKVSSLALPPLGCGNGELKWSKVGPVMAGFLEQLPLKQIEVYLPQGWEQYHITY